MKFVFSIFTLLCSFQLLGQNVTPEQLGFRHVKYNYKSDTVDILIKSKKGEEFKKKPVLFFCQGSLPQPLIKFDEQGTYGVFPFNPDSLAQYYHITIVGKPSIPLIANTKTLGSNFTYIDSLGQFPKNYTKRNVLDYYVNRNIEIINYLRKQHWVSKKKLVLAGHSEGSTIAAKIASTCKWVSHLIYSGGNPMGRIMSMIQQSRSYEADTDSTRFGEDEFQYWTKVVANKTSMDLSNFDTYRTTFEFSIPPASYLEKLKIPALICYGTKDWSAPYNDFFRADMIRKHNKNFTFKAYIGKEHNYFPLTSDHKPDYDQFNWNMVANDWLKWLLENQ